MRYLALLLLLALQAQGAQRALDMYPWPLVADRALSRGDCARALRLLWPRAFEGDSEAIGRLGDIVESGACPDRGLPGPEALYARLIEAGAGIAKARLGRLREESGRDEEAAALYRAAVLGTIPDLWPTTRRGVFAAVLRPHPLPPALDAELARLEAVEADGALVVELARQLREGDGVPPNEAAGSAVCARGMGAGDAAQSPPAAGGLRSHPPGRRSRPSAGDPAHRPAALRRTRRRAAGLQDLCLAAARPRGRMGRERRAHPGRKPARGVGARGRRALSPKLASSSCPIRDGMTDQQPRRRWR